jgi:hypothetical protein
MDGELRSLFAKNLRMAQWTPVETGMTIQGVPDSEYIFPGGHQGWIEYKRTHSWMIPKSKSWPFQVAWISRRVRMGGRVFIAVRRRNEELWLVPGSQIMQLAEAGVAAATPLSTNVWKGGLSNWNWKQIEAVLRGAS